MSTINVTMIRSAINEAGVGWQAAENEFTAMTEDERSLWLGFTPGPNDMSLEKREEKAMLNFRAFAGTAAGKKIRKKKVFGHPTSFDWRNRNGANYVTPIKDQKSCGSCVAFGTIAATESRYRIQRGAPNLAFDLSEAHLFYCHAKSEGRNCNNGWWPDKALEALKSKGVVDEACFPYTPGDQACKLCSNSDSRLLKISGYTKLDTAPKMKEWISTNGPVETCFTVYNDFFSYKSGIYKRVSNQVAGGHCVCVVGFDDINQYWICKNSWGTGWGENGFFRIKYGECGIDSVMHGVNGIVETFWISGKKVTGLWANNADRNAYAYIQDFGWRRVSPTNDNIFLQLLMQLVSAKNRNQAVSIHLTNGVIDEIYN